MLSWMAGDGEIGVRIQVGCIEGVHLGGIVVIDKFQVLSPVLPEFFCEAVAAGRNLTIFEWKLDDDQDNLFVTGSNTLGMVVFSVVMGITLAKMKEEGRALLAFFDSLSAAMLMMTSWVIWSGSARLTSARASERASDWVTKLASVRVVDEEAPNLGSLK
ncbi:unnamed protein product [Timema podura]|uniref:Amino acid transporter n=1 Tax=Timema podura TaxID=61482 RepID=A0ABN7PEE2_TIMPD|nr:unnamed protein product [Timema podura]